MRWVDIVGIVMHHRWHQEAIREGDAASGGDLGNQGPPAPRYFLVVQPAVYAVAVEREPAGAGGVSDSGPAPKVFKQLRVTGHDLINLPMWKICQASDSADDLAAVLGHALRMPKIKNEDTKKLLALEYGKRLRLVREAMGYTVRVLARISLAVSDDPDDVKLAETQLSKWELGYTEVPPDFVSKLHEQFGIDHNYIFRGSMAGLPDDLRRKLIEKMRDPS